MSKRETGGGKGKGPIVVKWRADGEYLVRFEPMSEVGVLATWSDKQQRAMRFASVSEFRKYERYRMCRPWPWSAKVLQFIRLVPRRPHQEQP